LLEFKVTEELEPNSEILEIIKDYKHTTENGEIKVLLNTNLQFVAPTIYTITYPAIITIFEYKVDEISGKPFYIKEHNKKYNFKEIKQILLKL
jgi:hypothetical protein